MKWSCSEEDLQNPEFKFRKVVVVCEGFEKDDDEYILKGSCWVNNSFINYSNCPCKRELSLLKLRYSLERKTSDNDIDDDQDDHNDGIWFIVNNQSITIHLLFSQLKRKIVLIKAN